MAINASQRRQHAMMAVIERRYAKDMRAELIRAMREYVAQWEATGEFAPIADHKFRVEEIFARYVRVAIVMFGATILDAGKGLHNIERKDFAETMARVARRYIMLEGVRRRITSITETTRANIIGAVARGFDEGLGQQAIAAFVLDVVADMATSRAAMIARTETHGAANYGSFAAAEETGLELEKEWISAEDSRTRPDHEAANGQRVPMDSSFDVGGEALMYPGDPSGSAEQVINCRCTVGYVVKD